MDKGKRKLSLVRPSTVNSSNSSKPLTLTKPKNSEQKQPLTLTRPKMVIRKSTSIAPVPIAIPTVAPRKMIIKPLVLKPLVLKPLVMKAKPTITIKKPAKIIKKSVASSSTDILCVSCWESCYRPIECYSCQTIFCEECLIQNMSVNKVFPSCVNCRNHFDEIFLSDVLPTSRITFLRKFIRIVLLDREKSKFPEDMEIVQREMQYEEELEKLEKNSNHNELYQIYLDAKNEHARLQKIYKNILEYNRNNNKTGSKMTPAHREAYDNYRTSSTAKNIAYNASSTAYSNYKNQLYNIRQQYKITAPSKTKAHIIPCGWEGCAGFLSRTWKCMLCSTKKCSKCHEFKAKGHECDPQTVATVNLYMQDTKPCPKCGFRIGREIGCDHMWCEICKTSFDYEKGIIISDAINSNPHFLKYLKKMKKAGQTVVQTNGDDVCQANGLQNAPPPSTVCLTALKLGYEAEEVAIILSFRDLVDNVHGEPYEPFDCAPSRQAFLRGKISEKKLENTAFLAYRRNEKNNHGREIERSFKLAGVQVINELMTTRCSLNIIYDLIHYINESFCDIYTKLGYKAFPYISKTFIFMDRKGSPNDEKEYRPSKNNEKYALNAKKRYDEKGDINGTWILPYDSDSDNWDY